MVGLDPDPMKVNPDPEPKSITTQNDFDFFPRQIWRRTQQVSEKCHERNNYPFLDLAVFHFSKDFNQKSISQEEMYKMKYYIKNQLPRIPRRILNGSILICTISFVRVFALKKVFPRYLQLILAMYSCSSQFTAAPYYYYWSV